MTATTALEIGAVPRHAVGMARVTKTAWFGPKRWGWGWSPVAWQGWVVVLVVAVAGQILKNVLPPRKAAWSTLGIAAAFMGVVVLTGDPPGHRRRAETA